MYSIYSSILLGNEAKLSENGLYLKMDFLLKFFFKAISMACDCLAVWWTLKDIKEREGTLVIDLLFIHDYFLET